MRTYYQKNVLTFMCCANELFYVCLYLLHFTYGPLSKFSQLTVSQIVKYLTNIYFNNNIYFNPTVFGMSLFKALAYVVAPFALLKSSISCLHAYVASIDLVALDMREREAKREKEEAKKAE